MFCRMCVLEANMKLQSYHKVKGQSEVIIELDHKSNFT